MPRFVAFLRAINVGGHVVKMDALRAHFETLGFTDVKTFIASGNVLFTSRSKVGARLERTIERHLHTSLGYEVKTFVRTAEEVAAIAAHKPFTEAQLRTAHAVNVGFFAAPVGPAVTRALMALRTDDDDFHVRGREVYWLRRKSWNEGTLDYAVFERTLKATATFRGVNTVSRLAAQCAPLGPSSR